MFESKDLTVFTLDGQDYPIKCDLYVMEKVQEKVGDIIVAEDMLRGYVPHVDADGVVDRTIGRWTIPDISLVTQTLVWMMEEGKEITEGDYDIPTVTDLKRQDEYTATELAIFVYTEFEFCLAGKKKRAKNTQKKTATKTARRRR